MLDKSIYTAEEDDAAVRKPKPKPKPDTKKYKSVRIDRHFDFQFYPNLKDIENFENEMRLVEENGLEISDEARGEYQNLLDQGFGNWKKVHF